MSTTRIVQVEQLRLETLKMCQIFCEFGVMITITLPLPICISCSIIYFHMVYWMRRKGKESSVCVFQCSYLIIIIIGRTHSNYFNEITVSRIYGICLSILSSDEYRPLQNVLYLIFSFHCN